MKFTVTLKKICKKSKTREDKVSKSNYQDSRWLNKNLENWQAQNKI